MQALKVILFIFLTVICASVFSQNAYDMQNWKSRSLTKSTSVNDTMDRVLVEGGTENLLTPALLLSYKKSPQEVAMMLQTQFLDKYKIQLQQYTTNDTNLESLLTYMTFRSFSNLSKLQKERIKDSEVYLQSDFSKVQMKFRQITEIKMISNKLKGPENKNASTQYIAYIYDAKELMGGIDGSIVIVFRMDEYRELGWYTIHDPFSFGLHKYNKNLVDSVIKNAIVDNTTVQYKNIFILNSEFFIDSKINQEAWLEIRKSLL